MSVAIDVFKLLLDRKPMTTLEIAEVLDIDHQKVKNATAQMRSYGQLKSERRQVKSRVPQNEWSVVPGARCPRENLKNPKEAIHAWIVEHGPAFSVDICDGLGVTVDVVRKHCRKMCDDGMLKKREVRSGTSKSFEFSINDAYVPKDETANATDMPTGGKIIQKGNSRIVLLTDYRHNNRTDTMKSGGSFGGGTAMDCGIRIASRAAPRGAE